MEEAVGEGGESVLFFSESGTLTYLSVIDLDLDLDLDFAQMYQVQA